METLSSRRVVWCVSVPHGTAVNVGLFEALRETEGIVNNVPISCLLSPGVRTKSLNLKIALCLW